MKRVGILGSGFTLEVARRCSHSVPITAELFREGLEYFKDSGAIVGLKELAAQLPTNPNIDVETLYDMIDIALQAKEHLWAWNTTHQRPYEPGPLREQLLFLITEFLRRKTFTLENGTAIDGLMLDECRKLFTQNKKNLNLWCETILTLNWDVLVDRSAIETNASMFSVDPDWPTPYGFWPEFIYQHEQFQDFRDPKDLIERPGKYALLKLHGSLNWFRCRDDKHTIVMHPAQAFAGSNALDNERDRFRCPQDKSKLDPLILPPSSAKNYSLPPFLTIWRHAFEALKTADELLIFGCSIREADFRLRDLMLKALVARGMGQIPKVVAVSDRLGLAKIEERLRTLGYTNIELIPVDEL